MSLIGIKITTHTIPMIRAQLSVRDARDFLDGLAQFRICETPEVHYFVMEAGGSKPLTFTQQVMASGVFRKRYFTAPSADEEAWFSVTKF